MLRIGYVPYSENFERPGDKRRFIYYAKKRNIKFEIADPKENYDLIILTQNADLSTWIEYCKNKKNTKFIYDAIDSYLAIPKTNIKACLRGMAKYIAGQSQYLRINYWKTISEMCKIADAVVCSTKEQRNEIIKYNKNVHINLDAHFEIKLNEITKKNIDKKIKLVWEGLPENISSLKKILKPINILKKKYDIELIIISDPIYKKYLGKYGEINTEDYANKILKKITFYEWSENTIATHVSSCDIAIIPIDLKDKFASGKPENKLLLFWRLGIPVITSPTPAYVRVMKIAGNACTARNEKEWVEIICKMIEDKEYRSKTVCNGKMYIEKNHNENLILQKWDAIFNSIGVNFR